MTGYTCADCGFKLWIPVFENRRTHLGLYDDARFPGRCLLVFTNHVEHVTDLSREDACQFLEDARRAAGVIQEVSGARRINYAILGNTEPHLHMHLIPRFESDPKPELSPWEDPRPKRALTSERLGELVSTFRERLRGDLKA